MTAVMERCPLKGTPKLVLLGIAMHDGPGGSWPSIETLATYGSVNRRNTQKTIDELIAGGWIDRRLNAGGTVDMRSDRRPNRYSINWDRLYGVSDATRRDGYGVSHPTQRGVACDAYGVSHATPEQILEPTLEPTQHIRARVDENVGALSSQEGEGVEVNVRIGDNGTTYVVDESDRIVGLATSDYSTAPVNGTRLPVVADPGFEGFWSVWPRKVAKRAAMKAWTQATKRADADKIIAGARRYAADPNLPERKFIPYPATWLNADRWDDEPEPDRRTSSAPKGLGTVLASGERRNGHRPPGRTFIDTTAKEVAR